MTASFTFSPACFTELDACYRKAARISNFFERTETALDCELSFVLCLRIYL